MEQNKIIVFNNITSTPFHSKSVKLFFNSDNLVIKEIFYKDKNCTDEILTIKTEYKNSKKICTYIPTDMNWKQITVFNKHNRVLNSVIYAGNHKLLKTKMKNLKSYPKSLSEYSICEKFVYNNDAEYNYIVTKYDYDTLIDERYYKLNKWDLLKAEHSLVFKISKIITILLFIVVLLMTKSIILTFIPFAIFIILSINISTKNIKSSGCNKCNKKTNGFDYVYKNKVYKTNYKCADCLNDIACRLGILAQQ